MPELLRVGSVGIPTYAAAPEVDPIFPVGGAAAGREGLRAGELVVPGVPAPVASAWTETLSDNSTAYALNKLKSSSTIYYADHGESYDGCTGGYSRPRDEEEGAEAEQSPATESTNGTQAEHTHSKKPRGS